MVGPPPQVHFDNRVEFAEFAEDDNGVPLHMKDACCHCADTTDGTTGAARHDKEGNSMPSPRDEVAQAVIDSQLQRPRSNKRKKQCLNKYLGNY